MKPHQGGPVGERDGGHPQHHRQQLLQLLGQRPAQGQLALTLTLILTLALTLTLPLPLPLTKAEWLPRLTTDCLGAFCLSEAASGSS